MRRGVQVPECIFLDKISGRLTLYNRVTRNMRLTLSFSLSFHSLERQHCCKVGTYWMVIGGWSLLLVKEHLFKHKKWFSNRLWLSSPLCLPVCLFSAFQTFFSVTFIILNSLGFFKHSFLFIMPCGFHIVYHPRYPQDKILTSDAPSLSPLARSFSPRSRRLITSR